VVIVPEVPEWVALDLAPRVTGPTVEASIRALRKQSPVPPAGPVGLMGFSFGAPQAVIASADPALEGEVGAAVGFGGYCDLRRVVRFQLTGRHEWRGRERYLSPDPYGRWIVAANFLADVPGHEDAEDVAGALRELAKEAGDRRVQASDPVFDSVKERLRLTVAAERRELFDLFAPASDTPTDLDRAEAMVEPLVEAASRREPLVEPEPYLERVKVPVHLLHGRNDRLMPYSESLRLAERLPGNARKRVTVTGLFAHSSEDDPVAWPALAREYAVFAGALSRLLVAV
jgi:pimeloyl-ACP methyl ester carboxylesterase